MLIHWLTDFIKHSTTYGWNDAVTHHHDDNNILNKPEYTAHEFSENLKCWVLTFTDGASACTTTLAALHHHMLKTLESLNRTEKKIHLESFEKQNEVITC